MMEELKKFIRGDKLSLEQINELLPIELKVENEKTYAKNTSAEEKPIKLTNREKEIVVLIKKGFTNKEISTELEIKYETVKTHRKNIYAKLSVSCASDIIHLNYTSYGEKRSD